MNVLLRSCGLLLAAIALAAPAWATLYRCGNVFQDRPCEAGVQGQQLQPGKMTRPAPSVNSATGAASPFASQCAGVGEHAQRITWKREGGATLEQQINEARGDQGMIALIQSVYARRGPAPQVRATIEAECIAERERQAAATDVLNTLKKQATAQPMGPSDAPAPAPAPASAAAPQPAAQPAPSQVASRCNNLKSRHQSVEKQLRDGGTAVNMEHWQNQRRDLERQMSDARC